MSDKCYLQKPQMDYVGKSKKSSAKKVTSSGD